MKIIVEPKIMAQLMSYAAATRLEFSGFGFCERTAEGDIKVYDFVLMDVGSEGYTEIDPKRILPLMEREDKKNMKVWIHQHPINNWSNRDLQTILHEPLGSTPELVGWSVSMVLTPNGWIGRIDNYKNNITKDLDIEPNVTVYLNELRELQAARHPFHYGQQPSIFGLENDIYEEPEDEPEDEYEYESGPFDEGETTVDDEATLGVLIQLSEDYDPTITSLEDILRDYGLW